VRCGLATSGRSKGTGGTERARFTFTWVDVILARLWGRVEGKEEEDYFVIVTDTPQCFSLFLQEEGQERKSEGSGQIR
jgi:hypothetical protein